MEQAIELVEVEHVAWACQHLVTQYYIGWLWLWIKLTGTKTSAGIISDVTQGVWTDDRDCIGGTTLRGGGESPKLYCCDG